jgi:hypothetical protein
MRLLIFSLITAMVWVFFSLFRTQQQTQIPPELLKLAEPLNPTIDTGTFRLIEQRRGFSPEELQAFPIYRIARDTNGNESLSTLGSGATPPPQKGSNSVSTPLPTPSAAAKSSPQ